MDGLHDDELPYPLHANAECRINMAILCHTVPLTKPAALMVSMHCQIITDQVPSSKDLQ